jgi:glycerophosphoryl diester phosphodiesterase
MLAASFDLQGHRGARGLKPENTLPSFEVAFDLGVGSVETDVHLTRDGVPVLCHDPVVSARLFRLLPGSLSPDPATHPLVRGLHLAELRGYRAGRNPDPERFPAQDAAVTPLARLFAERHDLDPYTPPTVAELFTFAAAYAGALGERAGKTAAQREQAGRVRFDLELKRVPFRPELIGDDFDGRSPALLERRVVEAVLAAGVVERTSVRSFDHRSVRAIRQLEPRLRVAVLVEGTAPVAPSELSRRADATTYCPDFRCLDEAQVQEAHAAGIRVVPWTVNDPADYRRLLAWGVDGITTDFPDRFRPTPPDSASG